MGSWELGHGCGLGLGLGVLMGVGVLLGVEVLEELRGAEFEGFVEGSHAQAGVRRGEFLDAEAGGEGAGGALAEAGGGEGV